MFGEGLLSEGYLRLRFGGLSRWSEMGFFLAIGSQRYVDYS